MRRRSFLEWVGSLATGGLVTAAAGTAILATAPGCEKAGEEPLPAEAVPPRPDRCETCRAWDGALCRRRAPLFGERHSKLSVEAWWTHKWVPTDRNDWCREWEAKA